MSERVKWITIKKPGKYSCSKRVEDVALCLFYSCQYYVFCYKCYSIPDTTF
jgi:hypothetical protein